MLFCAIEVNQRLNGYDDSFAGSYKHPLPSQLTVIIEVVFSSLELSTVDLFELLSRWKSVHIFYFLIEVLMAQTHI
jgi:hypothetical protein